MQNDNVKFKVFFIFAIFLAVLLLPKISNAATFFVDGNLSANCTTGNYSIANRACNGTDGRAYKILADGFANINNGDTLYIRGGTYVNTEISWNANYTNMTTVSGYGAETAILSQPKAYVTKIALSENANNITIKNLTFLGARYNLANTESWIGDGSNVYHVDYYSGAYIGSDVSGWHEGRVLYNGNGPCSDTVVAVAAGNDGDMGWCQGKTYVKSITDPFIRTDLARSSWGTSIGNNSSGNGYVVIENNIFNGTGHAHLKGGYKWWIKNNKFSNVSAGDFNDHDMYIFSNLSPGNEAIIENNYFESPWAGGAVHIYGPGNQVSGEIPDYIIIRNNIFNGKSSDFWCIALWAGHSTVAGNTCYGSYKGIEIGDSSPNNDFDVIENNIFYQYAAVGASWGSGLIQNLTFKNNLVYSTNPNAYQTYYSVGPGSIVSGNITNAGPSFIQSNPAIWSDFKLQSNSSAINAGINIGSPYNLAFDPNSASWPPSTIDQNSQGSGWEIGAFAYREAVSDTTPPAAPTGVVVQ